VYTRHVSHCSLGVDTAHVSNKATVAIACSLFVGSRPHDLDAGQRSVLAEYLHQVLFDCLCRLIVKGVMSKKSWIAFCPSKRSSHRNLWIDVAEINVGRVWIAVIVGTVADNFKIVKRFQFAFPSIFATSSYFVVASIASRTQLFFSFFLHPLVLKCQGQQN
jgi:hypothetical protein